MWRNQFEREFVRLKDRERQEGREYDLAECNAFIIQELRSRLEVQQYKALYGDWPEYPPKPRYGPYDGGHVRGMGGLPHCSKCDKDGHTVERCWFANPHLRPPRHSPPTTSEATPLNRGGRGVQINTDPSRPYRPPRSFSAPPPQTKGDDKYRGRSDSKGKGKGDGKGKGKGKGDGKGKGKGKGSSKKSDFKKRNVREVHIATVPPN